jgi:protein phosphatase PTC6
MYAFLKADLDFVTAQARKPDSDNINSDKPLNADDILGKPSHQAQSDNRIGGPNRFIGGSTASIVLISTPTPTPFWHPASPSTIVVAHVGDTRILLCETATGLAKPLTTNHHPSSPIEGTRLRRYAATFVTDSFGEERMSGLANTRAFGDMRSKRIGVSAEPEIRRVQLAPAEYSFLVLVSDGVSGTLTDQEIVDVVKEAKTPEQGARDVVSFATEVSREGDNATCLVVRLGGWERRIEGGMGSMGTKEVRDFRKGDALDPRRGRT